MVFLLFKNPLFKHTNLFLLLLNLWSVGLVGLSLSYALQLTGTQIFLSRWYCNLSNYIISVERIKQFMYIPPEPPATIEDKRPPSSWPSKGRIELHELKVMNLIRRTLYIDSFSTIVKKRRLLRMLKIYHALPLSPEMNIYGNELLL